MLLEGLHLPLTTPFYPDGRLYLRKLEHNVRSYSRTPAAGLAVLTGVGEARLLSETEMREVLVTAAEAAGKEKVLMAGVSRDSTAGTLALAKEAEGLGYDAVLVEAPGFLSGSGRSHGAMELLTYFRVVADQSALPIIMVSASPSHGGGALDLDLIAEMSRHSQVLGVVEMSGTAGRVGKLASAGAGISREVTVTPVFAAATRRMLQEVSPATTGGNYIAAETLSGGSTALAVAPPRPALRTRTKRVGFQVISGCTTSLLADLKAGAVGGMLPFSACAPQACYEVYAAWKDGDEGLSAEKQARLEESATMVEEELGVSAIKAGCDLNGYYGGQPRLPLLPVDGAERTRIERAMAGLQS